MNNQNGCVICGNEEIKLIYKEYPGYIEGTGYDIYNCQRCNINFILSDQVDSKLYDIVYSDQEIPGYNRYYKYALEVKKISSPLRYLADCESTYFPLYSYLKGKKDLKILEVGCGYGYLTYALKKMEFDSFGIDVSESAIKYARNNFGNNYEKIDLRSFAEKTAIRFDLIFAVEVIEHVINYMDFLEDMIKILKPDGKIILTTPNKNYRRKKAIWQTDLPPIHTIWFSMESFLQIAKQKNLNIRFVDFSKYYPKKENKLVKYIRGRKEYIQSPILDFENNIKKDIANFQFSFLHEVVRKVLHQFAPVRFISNLIYNVLRTDDVCIGAIFWKIVQ